MAWFKSLAGSSTKKFCPTLSLFFSALILQVFLLIFYLNYSFPVGSKWRRERERRVPFQRLFTTFLPLSWEHTPRNGGEMEDFRKWDPNRHFLSKFVTWFWWCNTYFKNLDPFARNSLVNSRVFSTFKMKGRKGQQDFWGTWKNFLFLHYTSL